MNQFIGAEINQYRLDAFLGEGGMGAVYRAHDQRLDREVALKIMHPHFAADPRFQQRFLNEAKAIARLDHPSIRALYDFGESRDLLFMAMAYIPGMTLSAVIRELTAVNKHLPLEQIVFIITQIADALGYAHQNGVLHRDIKPENILLKRLDAPERADEPPLRAILTDFGIALLDGTHEQTETGAMLGTLPYMAPEQCLGEQIDNRADLYSLGVILYQLTTGRLPLEISSPMDAVMKHLDGNALPPTAVNPHIPSTVAQTISLAIAKHPTNRFPDGHTFAQVLRESIATTKAAQFTAFNEKAVEDFLANVTAKPPSTPQSTRWEDFRLPPQEILTLVIARRNRPAENLALERGLYTVGRTEKNDIQLAENGVSGQHAAFEHNNGRWFIRDRGSTNGTFVNGARLEPHAAVPCTSDCNIRIGTTFFRLIASDRMPDDFPSPSLDEPHAPLPDIHPTLPPPETRFHCSISPTSFQATEDFFITIRNNTDARATYTINIAPENPFFELDPALRIQVGPQSERTVSGQLTVRERHLLGRARPFPSEWLIQGNDARQRQPVMVYMPPQIPMWLPLLIIAALITLAGALMLSNFPLQQEPAAGSGDPAAPIAGLTSTGTPLPATTPATAPATADNAAQTEDSDGDGLADADERALGTNPQSADTDGDGLTDIAELQIHNTNPAQADTDADGIDDATELNILGTDPLLVDSDSDGLRDNVDPSPRQPAEAAAGVPADCAGRITFELVAGASPQDGLILRAQFSSSHGVTFTSAGAGGLLVEREGPRAAFWGGGDGSAAATAVERFFVMPQEGGSSLEIGVTPATGAASFLLLTPSTGAAAQITLRDVTGVVLNDEPVVSSGAVYQYQFNRPTADVAVIEISSDSLFGVDLLAPRAVCAP